MQVTNFWFGDPTSENFRLLIEPTSLYPWQSTTEHPKVRTDSNGNIFHFAITANDYSGTIRNTVSLSKYDKKGNLLWSKHNKPVTDDTYTIATANHELEVDSSGNSYVISRINGPTNAGFLQSFDTNGSVRFTRQYGSGSWYPHGSDASGDNIFAVGHPNSNYTGWIQKFNTTDGSSDTARAVNSGASNQQPYDCCIIPTGVQPAVKFSGAYNPGPNTPATGYQGIAVYNTAVTSRTSYTQNYNGSYSNINYHYNIQGAGSSVYFVNTQASGTQRAFVKCASSNFSIESNVAITNSNSSSRWVTGGVDPMPSSNTVLDRSTEIYYVALRESATEIKLLAYDFSSESIVWQKSFTGNTNGNSDGTQNKNGMSATDSVHLAINGDHLVMGFRSNDHMKGVNEAHIICQFPKDMSSITGDWGGFTWADITEFSAGGSNSGSFSVASSFGPGTGTGNATSALNISTENYVAPNYPITSKYL